MQFLNVFKTSNVGGHVSCSFYPNPSQTYAKSLSFGKCSSHCTSSEPVYSRSNEQLLILLWSHGSAGQPLLLLPFIVSKWKAISSRKKRTYILGFIRETSRGCAACCVSLQLSLQCLALINMYFTKCLFPVLPRELGSFKPCVYLLQSCVYALASNLNYIIFSDSCARLTVLTDSEKYLCVLAVSRSYVGQIRRDSHGCH